MVGFRELARDSIFAAVLYLAPRFSNVLLFILIGRLAGPSQAGIFTLATTYLLIFSTVTRGLDDLTIREVARRLEKSTAYLTGFILVRLVLSLFLYIGLFFIVTQIFNYSALTNKVILVLSLGLFPDSLAYVAQAVLIGQRRFALPTLTFTGTSLVKLLGGGWVAFSTGNLVTIAWVWFFASVTGLVVLLTSGFVNSYRFPRLRSDDWHMIYQFIPVAVPFLAIAFLTTLETQSDTLVLSYFHGESQVGWYNAATTIAYGLGLISQAFRMAIYPVMTRYAQSSPSNLARLYHESLRYLATISFPMVAGIALLAPQIVHLIFGDQFGPTSLTLQILIPVIIFMFLNVPVTRMMLVQDRQGWISIFLIASAVTNIVLNMLLDPKWGTTGAAISRLISSTILFILMYQYVERHFIPTNLFRLISYSIISTIVMAPVVWLLRNASLAVAISVGALIFFITLWLIGGIPIQDKKRLWKLAEQIRKLRKSHAH